MEPLGTKLRRQRRRLGLTLDELAARTGISKPYLSLIETGRVVNPPSDGKLRKLEQTLSFTPGELLTQAHLLRTPRDVRLILQKLVLGNGAASGLATSVASAGATGGGARARATGPSATGVAGEAIDLDDAYLTGVLQEMVDRSAGNVEQVAMNAVPVVNRIAAGYPRDFTDLGYPARVADDYVGCPDVRDRDAFGCRVHGDSMAPKYIEGDIVIFSPSAVPRDGDDCFVRFKNGGTTFKRVFFETDESGRAVVRLQPRNERYRAQILPADEIEGLHRAVYRYQRVDEE